jgi:hypothetical protein
MKSTFWMTAQEAEDEIKRRETIVKKIAEIVVERRGTYQGVPQYGITGQAEITPSRATAMGLRPRLRSHGDGIGS